MKEYTLDIAKWRCGKDGIRDINALGVGKTAMCNVDGYQCCLGQFATQDGVDKKYLLNRNTPAAVASRIHYELTKEPVAGSPVESARYNEVFLSELACNTNIAERLMLINDNEETGIADKIKYIRDTLAEESITLKVINGEALELN